MSYYTGTIFEISIDGYNFSIAAAARYDEMIGRFSNQQVPACGFSIGFERIVTILKDLNWTDEGNRKERRAFLVDERVEPGKLLEVFKLATAMREQGMIVTVQPPEKERQIPGGNTGKMRIQGDPESVQRYAAAVSLPCFSETSITAASFS